MPSRISFSFNSLEGLLMNPQTLSVTASTFIDTRSASPNSSLTSSKNNKEEFVKTATGIPRLLTSFISFPKLTSKVGSPSGTNEI